VAFSAGGDGGRETSDVCLHTMGDDLPPSQGAVNPKLARLFAFAALLVFAAVTLARWGVLAWQIWHVVVAMHDLESMWLDWRGPKDDRPPHKLTQSELARLLKPFHVHPRSIWPARRRRSDKHLKSGKGYWRVRLRTGMAGLLPRRHTDTRRQGRLDRPPARAITVFLAHPDLLSVQAS